MSSMIKGQIYELKTRNLARIYFKQTSRRNVAISTDRDMHGFSLYEKGDIDDLILRLRIIRAEIHSGVNGREGLGYPVDWSEV
jgi:hypothetical protein